MKTIIEIFWEEQSIMRSLCVVLFIPSLFNAVAGQDADLARQAYQIFEKDCGKCHGSTNPKADLNMLRTADLLDGGYVIPTDLNNSSVWERVAVSKDMPDGAPPLDQAKLDTIRRWIEAGAPSFDGEQQTRKYLTISDTLTGIRDDLRAQRAEDRQYLRYYTLTHLHNNARVSQSDLKVFRAALSKLVNSLSWQHDLHIPTIVDSSKTIVRIDLRELGWDDGAKWKTITTKYPYGLVYDNDDDVRLREIAREIYAATGTRLPVLRADWFIRSGAAPPLYHELLELPAGANADGQLEQSLGVNIQRDILEGRLHRAAFIQSNVSLHNRLVDRHVGRRTRFGGGTAYYWKSYDFASSAGDQDLTQKPLGPVFAANPDNDYAFRHDGGEVVFSLPNGLQGYLIVDANGNRLDEAPISVVVDSERKPLNSPVVVNGISCMACHDRGIRRFTDTVRKSHALFGESREKVQRLFTSRNEMDAIIAADESAFLKAQNASTKPFIDELNSEPVSAISRFYVGNLSLNDVASELGERDIGKLKILFESTAFREYGMATLVHGGVIKREAWEKLDPPAFSQFHDVADELQLGEPYRQFE